MTTISFLDLPHEVRVLIYNHLFTNASVALGTNTSAPLILAPVLSILLTNSLCYTEAKPIFYRLATFHLKFPRQSELEYPGPSLLKAQKRFGANAQYVNHLCYYGKVPKLIDRLRDVLPNLKLFEMSLFYDFFHSDQTNFERAMRYVMRYSDWKIAVQEALDSRFPRGMRDAVAVLRHMGPDRGFRVKLHWRMGFRFIEFQGEVDLDEWILRVRDPDGNSNKVYDIPQSPLEPTWAEGRLTLPPGEGNAI